MAVTKLTPIQHLSLKLRASLRSIIGQNSPDQVREQLQTIAALKSAQNTAGLANPVVTRADGKCVEYQYEYFKPDCSPTNKEAFNFCDDDFNADKGNPKTVVTASMDCVVSDSGTISWEQYRKMDEDPDAIQAHEVEQMALRLINDMSCHLVEAMRANVGSYPYSGDPSGVSTKTLPISTPEGNINKRAFSALKNNFRRHSKTPIILGGQEIMDSIDLLPLANTQGGVDFNPSTVLAGAPIFADYKVDETLDAANTGDSYALAWVPGAFRLIEGYDNVGKYEVVNHPDITKTTIELFGVRFDFFLKIDHKCSTVSFALQKKFDLFCLPEACYDDCLNYTSKLLFKLGCGEPTCEISRC